MTDLEIRKMEIRFHIVNTICLVVAATIAVIAIVYYVRRDNDRTRDLICGVVKQVQLKTDKCIIRVK